MLCRDDPDHSLCQRHQRAASDRHGVGIGALAGVLLGDSRQSAAMGAAVCALGGYVWSKNMEDKKQAIE